ncbi:MAG: DUF3160 domain-containing protein [Lachnospiraceae bacterium]|nr:DUF3160 domain-containing protein [Lachnospiraceae bacterium]
MNEHDLLDAVGGIDGKYVENASHIEKKKKKSAVIKWLPNAIVAAAALAILVGIAVLLKMHSGGDKDPDTLLASSSSGKSGPDGGGVETGSGFTLANISFKVDYENALVKYTPSVAPYQANADLSNVKDSDRYTFRKELQEKLVANNFVVTSATYAEFFDLYEENRYLFYPSFITSDSMMHTYHLYFAMLQKKVEKQYLCGIIETLTSRMLANSMAQYDVLKGSEWEDAATRNVAYFALAAKLLGMPKQAPDYAKDIVDAEYEMIMAANGIYTSPIMDTYEDYSQYKPRSYYDGDEQLERYFRTMMLYGHMNYAQQSETMNRCALLMTLAMYGDDECKTQWGNVYGITQFFVGASDDLGYFEYLPAIDAAYGKDVTTKDLIGKKDAFQKYVDGIADLRAPEINSVVFDDNGGVTDRREDAKGFRFMGQRFTLDAAVFTQLTYSQVKEAADGAQRLLPDGLDIPAAFGSDLAVELLVEAGNDRFPNYLENLEKVRKKVQGEKNYWGSSLYAGWLHTLMPLLEERGEGYPSFMTNREWTKKSLEGYLSSWTELKHDTLLYAKQSMAEMGGPDIDEYDDRGYVEPQPELYARLYALTTATAEGLEARGCLGAKEKEGLGRLAEMAMTLRDISVKELQNETLTEAEYDFIREYGGALEHLWYDTVKDEAYNNYADSSEFPIALVADVATDPNGFCLEEAIGGASKTYVIFPIDGELHIGVGAVFTYYQFVQLISDRMTDKEWRIKLGMELTDDYTYKPDFSIEGPKWTESYRYNYRKATDYDY